LILPVRHSLYVKTFDVLKIENKFIRAQGINVVALPDAVGEQENLGVCFHLDNSGTGRSSTLSQAKPNIKISCCIEKEN
jgi:transposase InsO family protein